MSIARPELEGLGNYEYGWHDVDPAGETAKRGLSEAVVRDISAKKNEPAWMLERRLKGLELFGKKPLPNWGADLTGIDFDNIKYFVRSTEKQATSWDELPDEIKRLMIEHPIQQPTMGMSSGAVLSDDLVEKASRLMNSNAKGEQIKESSVRKQSPQQSVSSSLTANQIRDIVRETVEDVLKENGLLVESETRSQDMFKFRVGQHLFEGKVNKVKKMSK